MSKGFRLPTKGQTEPKHERVHRLRIILHVHDPTKASTSLGEPRRACKMAAVSSRRTPRARGSGRASQNWPPPRRMPMPSTCSPSSSLRTWKPSSRSRAIRRSRCAKAEDPWPWGSKFMEPKSPM